MKKKFLLVLFCAVGLVALYFTVRAIFPNDKIALSPPSEIGVVEYNLTWGKVRNAIGYEVDIDGEIFTTDATSIKLSLKHQGSSAKVRSIGEGERYASSAFSQTFTIKFSENFLEYADYLYYIFDGKGGSYFLQEFNYKDALVSIAAADLSNCGYDFVNWYIIEDGERVDLTQPIAYDGSLTLYANANLKTFTVEYMGVGYDIPSNAPTSYTIDTCASVAGVTVEKEGYRIVGWFTDPDKTKPLPTNGIFTGDLQLYPRISLINESLRFEKTDGGYTVIGCVGDDKYVHIPAYYNGERVVSISQNAFDSDACPNVISICAYGDITVKSRAVDGLSMFNSFTAYGNAVVESEGFRLASGNTTEFVFYGKSDLSDDFYTYLLGVDEQSQVIIKEKDSLAE